MTHPTQDPTYTEGARTSWICDINDWCWKTVSAEGLITRLRCVLQDAAVMVATLSWLPGVMGANSEFSFDILVFVCGAGAPGAPEWVQIVLGRCLPRHGAWWGVCWGCPLCCVS